MVIKGFYCVIAKGLRVYYNSAIWSLSGHFYCASFLVVSGVPTVLDPSTHTLSPQLFRAPGRVPAVQPHGYLRLNLALPQGHV